MIRLTIKILLVLVVSVLCSCANEGYPPGGPEDFDPPVLLKSTPALNELNYKGNEIKIIFDENVVLKDLQSNFIISPPLQNEPEVRAYAKEVRVKIEDTLQTNTTYTLYFGNSILDNNNSNILEDFSFAFSTGEEIDSLVVSGMVLNSYSLDPVKGAIIGLYRNLHDSAFIKNVPIRIAKTDEDGMFSLRNVPYGKFRIYALNDVDNNFKFNQPGEEIAFLDTIIQPYFDTILVADTVFADSLTIDTILQREVIKYFPDSLILLSFKKESVYQTLKKKERKRRERLDLVFASAHDSVPKLKLLSDSINDAWNFPEFSITHDTIYFWITDSMVYNQDSLEVELSYLKTDSMSQYYWQTDTVELNFRAKASKKKKRKKKDEDEKEPNPTLDFTSNLSGSMGYKSPFFFEFNEPIDTMLLDSIRLIQVVDTIETALNFRIEQDTNIGRRYFIRKKLNLEHEYRIEWDSAAITNIYGVTTDKFKKKVGFKGLDEYSEVQFNLRNVTQPGILYLLNSKDEIVRGKAFVGSGKRLEFKLLQPGTYFAKLFIDTNENGIWDNGDYTTKTFPEQVFYFHKELSLKANWTVEEEWDIISKPIYKQKPEQIKGLDKEKRKR